MKVLITGQNGYVGRVLTNLLLKNEYDVLGCDINYFPAAFDNDLHEISNVTSDIRDITEKDLKRVDVVMHLAGLSNDPLGELNSKLTHEINYLSTVRLAKISKQAGVQKFIFSSSCSTYGKNLTFANENSDLDPLTEYAKSKVKSESEILALKDEEFCPTVLRNATVYGNSPSLRLDLVVNNLTASAFLTGKVKLLSDGTAWRPQLHVEDMSSAFLTVMESSEELIRGQIFNVGNNDENFKIYQIAEEVERIVPNSEIEFVNKSNKDSRSYKVVFTKINNTLGFKTKWNLEKGIKQLYDFFKKEKLVENDFHDKKFNRLKQLKWLIENGFLDENLRLN